MKNSFNSRSEFNVGSNSYELFRLDALKDKGDFTKLPFALKILLENLLRNEDGVSVKSGDIENLLNWDPNAKESSEIGFMPSRVLLQDFTGVPVVVDLASMRDAMEMLGGDPNLINPIQPVDLVIDHSVQVDKYGTKEAVDFNSNIEFERNTERYSFMRWAQSAFNNFRVVPPATGIVHQVNLEYLADVVSVRDINGSRFSFPDTVVGTDSHTTMINGIGVLGWGVGGIEAEAAMLGQHYSMLIPEVIGFRLTGELSEGTTATDLVLVIVEILRKRGVVGKFVEFFGSGMSSLPLANRATISNMAPEYGATCGIFPIDKETIKYLELTGRSKEQIDLVEAYSREQSMFWDDSSLDPSYTDVIELDLSDVEPSISGPKRPQDRISLKDSKTKITSELDKILEEISSSKETSVSRTASRSIKDNGHSFDLGHGSVVIAAITSCTNTSNPSVMLAAGILAKKAVEAGLMTHPWVKTSLAPGSKVVTEYLNKSGLYKYLEELGFNVVGYGCTTCIGNSGPLSQPISKAIADENLVVSSVLSGNRNFEGRVHAEVRMSFLASPPLVVAYALAGTVDIDFSSEPLGNNSDGEEIYLKDIWPSQEELQEVLVSSVKSDLFEKSYGDVFTGDLSWQGISTPEGSQYSWDDMSTYVRKAPYFDGMKKEPEPVSEITNARCLALLGDSITTDHISPAGSIKKDSPGGQFLVMNDVLPDNFNSYGSRRGNHEVMMRGTFANVRLRNQLAPGTEGGFTKYFPTGEVLDIFEAANRYKEDSTSLIVLAGKEYGTGSSRDWAAKGSRLLGVKAVIAQSFERIHRSNLIGMGVLPLQFKSGENADSLGLTGEEIFSIIGLNQGEADEVSVIASSSDKEVDFNAIVRIDTPNELAYYQNEGILQYVLRQLLKQSQSED
ncbi:MAG: aconitate hydratase AcnA [Nitrospinota bacterium]|nr:aconitate hydratase AcnA [Nitrospinota bacterium]